MIKPVVENYRKNWLVFMCFVLLLTCTQTLHRSEPEGMDPEWLTAQPADVGINPLLLNQIVERIKMDLIAIFTALIQPMIS